VGIGVALVAPLADDAELRGACPASAVVMVQPLAASGSGMA
jgi:hypothetical protein